MFSLTKKALCQCATKKKKKKSLGVAFFVGCLEKVSFVRACFSCVQKDKRKEKKKTLTSRRKGGVYIGLLESERDFRPAGRTEMPVCVVQGGFGGF